MAPPRAFADNQLPRGRPAGTSVLRATPKRRVHRATREPQDRTSKANASTRPWPHGDESVVAFLEERLAHGKYAAIGEFHLYGADADLPVPRRMVALAKQYQLVLHAHADTDAIERLFRQDPDARILWAHAGFERPEA